MPAAGVDVSDQSVKFVELESKHGHLGLRRFGETDIPFGAVRSGEIENTEALVGALKVLRERDGVKNIVASLPEEAAYIVPLRLPLMKRGEIRSSIELQLEEHIPIPATDAVFDYEILSEPTALDSSFSLVVTALPKRIVSMYSEAFAAAGFRTLALEIEAQAIARALVPHQQTEVSLIVDFGKTRISFFIVRGTQVILTATINNIGGEDLTKAIQKTLAVSYEAAEKLKIERGLAPGGTEKEAFFALVPLVSAIRDEITKQLDYWLNHQQGVGKVEVKKIILCGGQATLPGLVDYLNISLGVPVVLANTWVNLFSFDDVIPPINLNQSLRYTTAIGLALRRVLPS